MILLSTILFALDSLRQFTILKVETNILQIHDVSKLSYNFTNLAKFLATPVKSPTTNLISTAQVSDETKSVVVLWWELVE